jgi:hypothetical protein
MKFWRRRSSDPAKRQPAPEHDRQIWLRKPKPTDALFPRFPAPADTDPDPGKDKIYADEIDPAWADSDTAEPAEPGDSGAAT